MLIMASRHSDDLLPTGESHQESELLVNDVVAMLPVEVLAMTRLVV